MDGCRTPGGGGAGCYQSSGGRGWHADGSPSAGTGFAGGGGGGSRTQSSSSNNGFPEDFQAGGATGIYGMGDGGQAFINSPLGVHVQYSRHGSNWKSAAFFAGPLGPSSGAGSITPPTSGSANHPSFSGQAASPGGGGAGIIQSTIGHGQKGGDGAVRIVWGNQSNGATRQYPDYDDVLGD